HYLHVMAKLGWLPVKPADLPPLRPSLSTETSYPPGAGTLAAVQEDIARRILREEIVFDQLSNENVRALLGGIYPGSEDKPLSVYPYGTPMSGFLLKNKAGARRVRLEIEVPRYAELYPFELEMLVDGAPGGVLKLRTTRAAGRHLVFGEIPTHAFDRPAVD